MNVKGACAAAGLGALALAGCAGAGQRVAPAPTVTHAVTAQPSLSAGPPSAARTAAPAPSSSSSDLHQVDWADMTIPGGWFRGPNQVALHDWVAAGVATHIKYLGRDEAETVYANHGPAVPAYGTLDGMQVAALQIWVSGAGTADSERAGAWLVYKAAPGGPVLIGTITPRVPPANSWSQNPRQAGHITEVTALDITSTRIVADEAYWRPGDIIADPSGRATTVWTYSGSTLVPGSPRILR